MASPLSVAAPASPPLAPARRPYYPALTGLRFVTALMVFSKHFRPAATPEWANLIIEQFHMTMSLFFLLSGFVMGSRYQDEAAFTRPFWRRYLWRRLARVYPMYLVLNTSVLIPLYWPVPAGQGSHTALLVFLSETLLRGFSSTLKYVGLPQAWSLTAEECFYFTLPFLLVLWRRYGVRGAAAFATTILFTGLTLTAICRGRPELHGFFGSFHHLFNFTFFGRVFEFTLGVGLARWWNNRPTLSLPGWPWRTTLSIALMLLGGVYLVKLSSPFDWYDGNVLPTTIAMNVVFYPLCMTLLLAGLLMEGTWLRAFLATPLLDALGKRAYAFYLVQIGLFSIWWRAQFGAGHYVGWQLLLTVLLAEAAYRFLEEPARRWILRRTLPRHEWS